MIPRALSCGAALALAVWAAPSAALELSLPVACDLRGACRIQQYPDRDAGPGVKDYSCGSLSYDGHKGLDIRVLSRAEMAAGVPVLSAAPGVVRAARDGMADIAPDAPGAPDTTGLACGNGVAIDHGQGWETQYCHMRRGSISVAPGDEVAEGAPLGLIGHSGDAAFPHLHFAVRRLGREIDPFDGRPLASPCGGLRANRFWKPAALNALAYEAGGPLDAGFAPSPPDLEDVRAGHAGLASLPATSPNLVFWVRYYGLRAGDKLRLTLKGPSGEELAAKTTDIPRPRAIQFQFIGRKRGQDVWGAGTYRGHAEILREGERIAAVIATVTVP